jgi:hypothetical protein
VRVLDAMVHQPLGLDKGADDMLLGIELSIQANMQPLLAALLDAAGEPLLFQQLRTAFLQCWCWRLLVLAVLQRNLQARTPGTNSSSSSSGGGSGGGADAAAVAADTQALQLSPPLQKMLRQLGVSRKVVDRAGTECFPPEARQGTPRQAQMVEHAVHYSALDVVLQQLSEHIQPEGSISTQQQQQLQQELVRTQLQLNMLIPGVVLQWAADLPADQVMIECRAAGDVALFANWHSQSLVAEQRRLREQQQEEAAVTVGYEDAECDDALPSGALCCVSTFCLDF